MPQLEIARNHTHSAASDTLADFIDLAEDAIVSVNRDRRIVFCNRAAERLFGYAPGELRGRPIEALQHSRCDKDHGAHVVEFPSSTPAGPPPPTFIASSESMRQLLRFATRVAVSEAATILIEGESGVGKDLLARFIHDTSRRCSKPFLAINCAAIPETLLESELFGYEKGAFADARHQKSGILEVANGNRVSR